MQLVFFACGLPAFAAGSLVLEANMQVLHAKLPGTANRFDHSNVPGQVFLPGEPVDIVLLLSKQADHGTTDLALEIQEITTRDPERKIEGDKGFSDTAGHAPLIALQGRPRLHPFQATFGDKPQATVEVSNLPLPERFGTYALVLIRNGKRQFLTTVCRVPKPREHGTIMNTPIFGEGQFIDRPDRNAERAKTYARMGVRGWRSELSWSENEQGQYDWSRYDALFAAAEKAGCKIMVTLGAHPDWTRPFKVPTPAVGWTPKTGGYSATGDWLADPKLYARYGRWITAFCQRYWKDGKGGLWGIENYNEPWEGGGISGWARDMIQYRALQKLIATSTRKVSPDIKLLAACSIMNTEDKFYSDGSKEFDAYVDIFTDHYVAPSMCYGPLVARAHGKQSMETETWFVNSEYLLPQAAAQFMAAGQARLAPWHPSSLYDALPGIDDPYVAPTPVVAATAAFNALVTGKAFEKIVFRQHLPWVFQFGKDDDNEALLVVFGQLLTVAGENPRDRPWAQVDSAAGGTMTIDNADGLLKFFDLAGNPAYVGQASVRLPMNIFPSYITCEKGPLVAAERIRTAQIDGKRPVEILPHDFSKQLAAGVPLTVELHNCLNRAIAGVLAVKTPPGLTLKNAAQRVQLKAGETAPVAFEIAAATISAANAYPCAFDFRSDAGAASYAQTMNVLVVKKGTRIIDGNLDDWKDVPGVTVVAGKQEAEVAEMMRRPWLDLKAQKPNGNYAEFKLAWDEKFLYIAARVNDPSPQISGLAPMATRDENKYFHTSASDRRSPYKEFLKAYPGKSFSEVPYVYCNNPEKPADPSLPAIPFRRDRLQIGLDVTPGWHDLKPDTDRVTAGFHAVPDTDYEYALYATTDGKSELWRMLAPGVPRMHDWPRQPRGRKTTGPVAGAKHVVKREGNVYIYEAAIPREELGDLKLEAGTTVGIVLRAGNNDGPNVDFGADKAVTKTNGLSLHPYWERKPSAGARWTLVD
ncbi:MAG TPA: hypothetical protein VHX65_02610 [Pirellulales bacterium]|nr:hypothetical protein [Pirellulales bacterium]